MKEKAFSKGDLERLLRKEANNLLGTDFPLMSQGVKEPRPSSQGLGRSIWFFRDARKRFTFSRKGLRIFTLR